jgi:hypothetical protein
MRSSLARALLFVCVAVLLTNCNTVPPLREDGVAISAIVRRVKCELAFAVPKPRGRYPTGPYQWMANWTAKVDLTLITNDQAAIAPGASFITPLTTATLPGVGTFPRNFSLGLGGGVTTTAIRNEVLSFTVSLKELRNPNYLGQNCDPGGNLDLYGHLGLKEWIESALAPVNANLLTIGEHAAPGASKAKTGGATVTAQNPIDKIHQAAFYADKYAADAEEAAKSAKRAVAKHAVDVLHASPGVTLQDLQDAFDQSATADDYAKAAADQLDAVTRALASLNNDQKASPAVQADVKLATDAQKRATDAKADANAAAKSLPLDPPIDSLAHQIQFVVMLTGNVTPTWTLVHFKGPGGTGSFASATDTRTHTLNIALGGPGTSVNASDDQLRQLDNLHLDALRAPPGQ